MRLFARAWVVTPSLVLCVFVGLLLSLAPGVEAQTRPADAGSSSVAEAGTGSGPGASAGSGADAGATVALAARGATLRRCLELAERNHPNVWAARARLKGMRAQLDEARSAPFSQFVVSGGLGLAPTVRGTDLYSPNTEVSLSSSMGLAWRIGIEGVVPLWTFGKMTNLWRA